MTSPSRRRHRSNRVRAVGSRVVAWPAMFALWGGVLILAQGPSVEMTLVSITSPVQIGELATLVIHTVAGAYCGIDNRQQLGPSKSPGLRPQRADEQGRIRWTWPVDETRTPPGRSVIRITCAVGSQQGKLEAFLVVR